MVVKVDSVCSWGAVVTGDLGVCVLRSVLVALCYLDCIWFGDLVSRLIG